MWVNEKKDASYVLEDTGEPFSYLSQKVSPRHRSKRESVSQGSGRGMG